MSALGIALGIPFRQGSGVFLPSDQDNLAQWLYGLDPDGITLLDKKDAVAAPVVVGANCRLFAGGTDHFSQPNALNISGISCRWSGSFIPSDLTGTEMLLALQDGTGTGDTLLYVAGTTIGTRIDNSNNNFVGVSMSSGVNNWSLEYNAASNTVDFTLNGVSATQQTGITAMSADGNFVWGASKNITFPFAGSMWDCKFEVLEESVIDVVLLLGDSTCVGISTTPPAELDSAQQHLYDYYIDVGAWQNSDQGFLEKGTDPTLAAETWGAELSMGYNISKKSAFIKRGVSGSTLGTAVGSGWIKTGALYSDLVSQITSALSYFHSQGYAPRISNVVINLGTNDSNNETNANAFYDNFIGFWEDIVADTEIPYDTPITLIRVNDTLENTYASTVRAAHDLLAANLSNLALINSNGFETRDDPPVHYSYQGNVDMGEADATRYNALTLSADETLSRYPLSGTDSASVYDISKHQNHATLTGTTVGDQDYFAYNLTGGFSDYISVGDLTFLDGVVYQYESFSQVGQTISCVSDGSSAAGVATDSVIFKFGTSSEYEITYNLTLNSGTAPDIRVVLSTSGRDVAGSLNQATVEGENTVSFTSSSNSDRRLEFSVPISTPTDFSLTIVSVKEIGSVIPAMDGEVVDATGSPITNPGASTESLVHNGCEVGILQTDADFDVFEALASLWGDGVTEWVAAYYAALLTHTNFSLGLVIRWKCVNGVYIVKETAQRGVDYAWTPADYLKDKRWSEKYCEAPAGALVPAEVTAGTGIGPGGTWTDNGDGKVLMVEDV